MTDAWSQIYWIGGSPCSGKSTVSDALAASFGMAVYRCDDAYYRHQALVSPERQPVFHRVSRLAGDALWLRPVAQQIDDELALYREEFPFIVAEVAELANAGPVIAEGAALLPELLTAARIDDRRCLWMVPAERFQRETYARRGWRHEVLAACSDGEAAWRNWMDRDVGFARAVAAEARALGRRVHVTDGTMNATETVRIVAEWFGLGSPPSG